MENHRERQKKKGYGFGYRVINEPGVQTPIASTLLATGGSGRERNLILDVKNGLKHAGKTVKGKYSPINSKCIRTMTPTEWGRLQGFINYAFVVDGIDYFAFPESVPNVQRYKQLGNSVTIPVVESLAAFISSCLDNMILHMSDTERRLQFMYGTDYAVCRKIYTVFQSQIRNETMNRYFDLVCHFSSFDEIHTSEIAAFLGVTSARGSQIVKQLCDGGCLTKTSRGSYVFLE